MTNNYTEKVTLRLSPTADAVLIDRINKEHGSTLSERLCNLLRHQYVIDAPDTVPGDPVLLNRSTSWLKGKRAQKYAFLVGFGNVPEEDIERTNTALREA